MLSVPQTNWTDIEWTKWGIAVAKSLRFNSFTWNGPNVPANSTVDTTLTSATLVALEGLRTGMPIVVTPPSTFPAGLGITAWVGADNSLTIRLVNATGVGIDPPSLSYSYFGSIL